MGKDRESDYKSFLAEIEILKEMVYHRETKNFLQEIIEIIKETDLNDQEQFLLKMRLIAEKICY